MAAQAKKDRGAAKVSLDSKIMNLESLTPASRAADLDNAWYAVRDELRVIEDRQNKYMLALMGENDDELPADGPTSEAALNQWYSDQITKVRTAEDTYRRFRFTDVEKQLNDAQEMLITEAACTMEQSTVSVEAMDSALVLLEKAHSAMKPLVTLGVGVVPRAKEGAMNDGIKAAMAKYHEAIRTVGTTRAAHDEQVRLRKEREEAAATAADLIRSSTPSSASTTGTAKAGIKFKPLENPVFNGEMRDYYRWKDDFTEVMQPRLATAGESEKLMTLKACLSADVKREVPSTCTTQKELFDELEKVFGNKEKIITMILKEVRNLKKPLDSEFKKQVALIRTVQRAVKDLTDLKSEYEIKNQTVLDELENKLPPKSFERWNFIIHDPAKPIKRAERFDKFLDFLKVELELAEYASKDTPVKKEKDQKVANTRTSQRGEDDVSHDSGCQVCNGPDSHALYKCPEFKRLKPKECEAKV